jgi:hypothetical protein
LRGAAFLSAPDAERLAKPERRRGCLSVAHLDEEKSCKRLRKIRLGEQSGSNLRGGLLAFPALLEAGLRKFGKSIWESAERADLRGSLRWLAQNWARVGAWWLIVGLVLTGLVAFASLVMWKSPQAVISSCGLWGSEITGYGTLGAWACRGWWLWSRCR